MYCIFIFQFPLPGTWAGTSRRIFSFPWSSSECSVHLCVSPLLCSKKGQSSEKPGRRDPHHCTVEILLHWQEQDNFQPYQHTQTARAVNFLLVISCPLLVFFPPICLCLPGPYSKKAFKLSHSELQAWRREHYHLQRAGGRAAGSVHGLCPSLTARAAIKTFTSAAPHLS